MGIPAPVPLDIIQIAYYAPALVVSFLVVRRHGAKRQAGWRYLILLALARLIGAATGIASSYNQSNKSLAEASDICESIGVSMLLGAALGILSRISENMYMRRVPRPVFWVIYLPLAVGLVLSIYGSTKIFDLNNPSSVADGYKYIKIGVVLFLLVLIVLCGITLWTIINLSKVEQYERRLVWAVAFSMPWLAIRIIYSMICAFSENSKYFSQFGSNKIGVVVHGVMGLLPEIVVVTTYLWAGMTAKKLDQDEASIKEPMYTQGPPPPMQRAQQV